MVEQLPLNLYGTRESSRLSNRIRESKGYGVSERNVIFKALKELSDMYLPHVFWTTNEVTAEVNKRFLKNYSPNNVSRALGRLRDKGKVRESETLKYCPISRRPVIAWRTK